MFINVEEPVEPPAQWSSCVKVENESYREHPTYVMDEPVPVHIARERFTTDLCSVKHEQDDEFSVENRFLECHSVKLENELHLVDEPEMSDDSNRSDRGKQKQLLLPVAVKEESVIPERSSIRLAERLAKETAKQSSRRERTVDQTETVQAKDRPKRGRSRKRRRRPATAEEEALKQERARIKSVERLANETAEQRQRRIEYSQWYRRNQSKQQRSKQRERAKLLKKRRLATETEEEKSIRVERQRMRNLRFRTNVTEEQREERLERHRTYRMINLARETEEQREVRLTLQKIAGLKWRSKKTQEQRNADVARARITRLKRLAAETEEEKLERIERARQARRLKYHEKKRLRAAQKTKEKVDKTATEQIGSASIKLEL
ncbi:hypothetical protein HA402_009820 [Bradysia odoriphaga]|nr:hypothetical protein HA402_009820 [Bradysia odoriphaga]